MDAMAPVFASFLNIAHSFRMELGFMASFALFWVVSSAIAGNGAEQGKSGGAKVASKRKVQAQAATTSVRRRSTPQPSSDRPLMQSGATAAMAVDVRSPSATQLCDIHWVTAAVQHLCPSQVQRAFELYSAALNAGLELERMPEAEGAQLFMALVTSAIRVGQIDDALSLLRDCRRGPGATATLLASCTRLCTSKQLFKEGLVIFDFFAEDPTLVSEDRSVWSCLLFCAVETKAFGRCHAFWEYLQKFGVPSNKDYGNMVRCACTQGDWRLSLSLIREMHKANLTVDSVMYNTALATCVTANQPDEARALLEEMEASNGVADVITYNTLSKGYAKFGKLEQCFELFRHMRSRNIKPSQVSYGILLDCCINEKKMDQAVEVFNEMTAQGLVMNTVLYTTLIKGFARAEQVNQAMSVYKQMREVGGKSVSPDLITFSILIKANCDAGRLEDALGLLNTMIEMQLCPDEVIFNNLLGGCVRENSSDLAKRLYNNMIEGGVKPSNATFSILVRLYAQNKMLDEAVEMLKHEPKARKVEPEPRLYVQLAQACLRERQGRRAIEVYKLMLEASSPTAAMHSSLLGMCMKLNMLDTAAEVLTLAAEHSVRIDVRDVVQVRDMAVRKRKAMCIESINAALDRLGLNPAMAA